MEAEKKAFKITKREIGFVLGIVVFLLVKFLPLAELSSTVELTVGGQTCLALTLATVVFWACGVTPQSIVMNSKPPFAITHAPGYMLITDTKNVDLKG